MITRRGLFSLLLLAPGLIAQARAAQAPMRLEDFLVGRLRGKGRFISESLGLSRAITLRLSGHMSGETLVLDQHITHGKDIHEHVVWRFRPMGEGYAATRDGVARPIVVRRAGSGLAMSYLAPTPGLDGKPIPLHFDDRLVPDGPNRAILRSVVKAVGLVVGRAEITISR